jgi:hypothetical protein
MTIVVANTELTNSFDYWRNRTNELAHAVSNFVVTTDNGTAVGNAAITGTFTCNTLVVANLSAGIFTTNNINSNTGVFTDSVSVGNSTVNTFITPTSILLGNTVITNTSVATDSLTIGISTVNTTTINVGTTSINSSAITLVSPSANVYITAPTAAQVTSGQFFLNANGQWSTSTSVYNPVSNNVVITSGTGSNPIDTYASTLFAGAEYTISVKDNIANNYYFTKLLTTHNNGVAYVTDYGGLTTNNSMGVFTISFIGTTVALNFTPLSTSTTVKFVRVIV